MYYYCTPEFILLCSAIFLIVFVCTLHEPTMMELTFYCFIKLKTNLQASHFENWRCLSPHILDLYMGREACYKVWSIWSDELMFNFKDMMTGCHIASQNLKSEISYILVCVSDKYKF